MRLGWNLGSAKSARNFPRSLTSPSHSVLMNLSPIMLATAVASRMTWAWFHIRSSATSLAVSVEDTAVCANAPMLIRRQQAAAFMMLLPLRIPTFSSIDCATIARGIRCCHGKHRRNITNVTEVDIAISAHLWGLSQRELGAASLLFGFVDLGRHFHSAYSAAVLGDTPIERLGDALT